VYEGACHSSDAGSKRDFIIAIYAQSASGMWSVPELPTRGLCGTDCGGCDLREHSYRTRKTGPRHRLLVVRCYTHGQAFTVYPAGYVPYARTSLEPSPMALSLFLAAFDASKGKRWRGARCSMPSWPTQLRHLARAGVWLGLCGGLQERAAEELGVALHEHGAAALCFSQGGYQARGVAVFTVLKLLEGGEALWPRLLRIGHAVGLCGRGYQVGVHRELQPLFR